MSSTTPRREQVLHLIREERARQIKQYGKNEDLEMGFGGTVPTYPWLFPYNYEFGIDAEATFREDYKRHVRKHGSPSWMHLIREEVAELFAATNRDDVMAEAIQVAALCTSLVELMMEKE